MVCSSGTAALQAAYFAANIGPGDEFITSPITFPATVNAGLWQGAKPIFVDVESETGNINTDLIEERINKKTKAIIPINYTGRPVDLEKIRAIAKKYRLIVIEDACQALGAEYKKTKIGGGRFSNMAIFSFHPVKSITTGEGGAILTNSKGHYKKLRKFINHGIVKEHFVNKSPGGWYFEMQALGQNYRLTDFQAALGISQLKKINKFMLLRRAIAKRYEEAFINCKKIGIPLSDSGDIKSAWHLYVVRLRGGLAGKRGEIFKRLRQAGIGVQIHHIPVYHHPYYGNLGYKKGLCPEAEKFYRSIISLPIFPGLTAEDQNYTIKKLKELIA